MRIRSLGLLSLDHLSSSSDYAALNVCICREKVPVISAKLTEACSLWKRQAIGQCLSLIRCTVMMGATNDK